MAFGGMSKRYAVGLFDAAGAEDVLEQVHDDVVSFTRLLEIEPALGRFLVSLRVTPEEKKDLLVRTLGDRASGLFLKLLILLIDKKRIDDFDFEEMAEAFMGLYEQHAGIVRVGVVTAVELDAELERKARATIERRTGKKATLAKRVDPAIIGGMIMIVGDRILDGSIRNGLGELRKNLLAARVH